MINKIQIKYSIMLIIAFLIIFSFTVFGIRFIIKNTEKENIRINRAPLILADDEIDFWKEIVLKSKSNVRNTVLYADDFILELRKRQKGEIK